MQIYFLKSGKGKYSYGKVVAINYYETEEGKILHVYKNLQNTVEPTELGYDVRDEYSILRTVNRKNWYNLLYERGYKRVFVNSDIDGNKIDITEEEIIQFVNMMNVDLYLRLVLYDPSDQYKAVETGYYTEEGKEIALNYISYENKIKDIEERIERSRERIQEGSDNAEHEMNYISDLEYELDRIKHSYRKFNNETVVNNSKVPTLAHCVGYCYYEDGEYYVKFMLPMFPDGFNDIYAATECEAAKKMLASNKGNNDSIKESIVSKINNTRITRDLQEYVKPKEIVEEVVESKEKNENELIELIKNDSRYLILFTMILLLIILIIILTIFKIRRKK